MGAFEGIGLPAVDPFVALTLRMPRDMAVTDDERANLVATILSADNPLWAFYALKNGTVLSSVQRSALRMKLQG